MSNCRYFRVSGRVQGVFFRVSTQDVARKLGVTGWVRNCSDGDVEGVACGEEKKLQALRLWLQNGPSHAEVANVLWDEKPFESFSAFEIRP